ncbi:MAG: sulfatase [Bryobacterales bacterium]|nr:sulfatase [Bryobacterales bacterium]
MKRRTLLAMAASAPSFAAETKRPNLVLFLSDDHGYFDSPVYGSKVVRTPALQQLAEEGMVFSHAFTTSPCCVPSRAALMSSLHNMRNGVIGNHQEMKPGIRTMPSYLNALGYRVAHFGKSHFQPRENYPDWEWVPSNINGGPLNQDLDPKAVEQWLAARTDRSQPVALFINCHSPHVFWDQNSGYDPADVELPPTFVDNFETRQWRCRYYTDITKMDAQLAHVRSSISRHLSPNTVFLYTSDNGSQWPFAKWNLYDAGLRMPFVISWPGVIPAASRSSALLSFLDILPTFVELAGGRPPAGIDGKSFAAVIHGKTRKHREEIYALHTGDKNMNVYPHRCIRTQRFKYILNLHPEFKYTTHIDLAGNRDGKGFYDTWAEQAKSDPKAAAILKRYHQRPAEELYDTESDPHESNNLAADLRHATTLTTLRAKLKAWMQSQGDTGEVQGEPHLL